MPGFVEFALRVLSGLEVRGYLVACHIYKGNLTQCNHERYLCSVCDDFDDYRLFRSVMNFVVT